jgi:transcriptional repressor NrdR
MDGLKGLDEVAYVRYASVYRSFTDIDSFMEELKKLKAKNGNN